MDWKSFWNQRGLETDTLAQVARVGGSVAQHQEMLDTIANHIGELLSIQAMDLVLDVCCGNGMLTAALRQKCQSITGVDFADSLIKNAKEQYPSIPFFCADVLNPETLVQQLPKSVLFDKINLYFSFQYFESFDKGKQVVTHLAALLKPGGKLLLGDIPDRSRFFVYYHSFQRIAQLIKQQLQNKNDMGKFWSEDELMLICKQLGLHGTYLKQPSHLPYAHYRFDFLIEKGMH